MITTVALATELGLPHEQVSRIAEQTQLVFTSEATGEIVDDAPVYWLIVLVEQRVRERAQAFKADREVYPRTPDNFRHDSFEIKD